MSKKTTETIKKLRKLERKKLFEIQRPKYIDTQDIMWMIITISELCNEIEELEDKK